MDRDVMGQATILVVDDEADVRAVLAEQLSEFGHRVVTAASAEAALDLLQQASPDLIISDVHMGEELIEVEPVGEFELKGFPRPVATYSVLRLKSGRTLS